MRPPLIVSLTEPGRALAGRLCAALGGRHLHRPQPFGPTVQQAFGAGEPLVLIVAAGIAVRTLAPVLSGKHSDPPVLVLDEMGRFVIPLLSGHEGGANDWAQRVAAELSAQCVITSARQYCDPVLVAGMGCERGCPAPVLERLLEETLAAHGLSPSSLAALASIELKHDEAGLIALAAQHGLPFVCYPAPTLAQYHDRLHTPSPVVFAETGCYGVAEGAALAHAEALTGAAAELIVPKHKNAQATVAIARAYGSDRVETTA